MSYSVRTLVHADLPAIIGLHQLILATNPRPEILRSDSPDHFEANIAGAGVTFGAFVEDTMVAYAALAIGGPAAELIVPHVIGLDVIAARVGVHDGSGVHPSHRGRDLQDVLNARRLEEASARGIDHVVGSVSTLNPYSLQNHFDFSFVVRGFARLYGGLDRAIIHRGPAAVPKRTIKREFEFRELGKHVDVLHAGLVGVSLRDNDGTQMLCLQNDRSDRDAA